MKKKSSGAVGALPAETKAEVVELHTKEKRAYKRLSPLSKFPEPFEGIDVNFCKNPLCRSYGVPKKSIERRGKKGASLISKEEIPPGSYSLTGSSKGFEKSLRCLCCDSYTTLRSNEGLAREVSRLIAYLQEGNKEPSCSNEVCKLHRVPFSKAEGKYVRNGKSKSGTQRYKCLECGKVFSGFKQTVHKTQAKSHKNRDVFMNIMNQMAINRLLETTNIGPQSFYKKLEMIHERCLAFAGFRESKFLDPTFPMGTMYLTTDRQVYSVNWSQRHDRRVIQLNAIATTDLESGYLLAFNLNFDSSLNPEAVEKDAEIEGDNELPNAWRKWARVWLKSDYDASVSEAEKRKATKERMAKAAEAKGKPVESILAVVKGQYVDALSRSDIEGSDLKPRDTGLPKHGMQVHEQYTLQAHFMVLERMLRNADKVRLYADQDSGFRAGFLAAFRERVKNHTAELFYVKIKKDCSAYEKHNAVANAKADLERFAETHGLSLDEAKVASMLHNIIDSERMEFGDRWAVHPLPIAAEPYKSVCWLTPHSEFSKEHVARLFLKATLHPTDTFFEMTRRRIKSAERPINSARSTATWNGYGAYNPKYLAMNLEILRVYYNFCLVSKKDKKTPAMRLGLAKEPIDPWTVLYFAPQNP